MGRGGAGPPSHVTPRLPAKRRCTPGPRVPVPAAPRPAMSAAQLRAAAQAAPRSVHAFSARPLAGGEPLSLGSLRGKVLLIENVASL